MDKNEQENAAREKIISLYGKPEGEYGPTLFVEHHLDQLTASEWQDICGTPTPTAEQVLTSLVLVGAWSSNDDDVLDVFDFSLPDNATQYVISVRFSGADVIDVDMES